MRRALAPLTLGLLVVTGCTADGGAAEPTAPEVPGTVALGVLPEPLSDRPAVPTRPTSAAATTTTTTEPEPESPIDGPVGAVVSGNRVLLIGDGVLASVAPRFEGIACDVLPGFGWVMEIAAEPGRFVEFGLEVLDERLAPQAGVDWDVVAVMLGNQYDGDRADFERTLREILDRVAPRPTLLYTISGADRQRTEVNEVIREQASAFPSVIVVDWAAAAAAEPERLLDDGGPTPTEEGSGRLVLFTAAALGDAPGGGEGECLPPVFTDDSAIVL